LAVFLPVETAAGVVLLNAAEMDPDGLPGSKTTSQLCRRLYA